MSKDDGWIEQPLLTCILALGLKVWGAWSSVNCFISNKFSF